MRLLVDAFFEFVHPERNLGFLHKPSFLRTLDQGGIITEYGEGAIYTICALGAGYIREPQKTQRPEKQSRTAGQAWGNKARDLARQNSCVPSVSNVIVSLTVARAPPAIAF